MVKLCWKKNPYIGTWDSTDGRWEISPAYEPSIRGGSVTRPSYWILKDKTGATESWSDRFLADCKGLAERRTAREAE